MSLGYKIIAKEESCSILRKSDATHLLETTRDARKLSYLRIYKTNIQLECMILNHKITECPSFIPHGLSIYAIANDQERNALEDELESTDEIFINLLNQPPKRALVYRDDAWISDSGSTHHLCGNADWFIQMFTLDKPIKMKLADLATTYIKQKGIIQVCAYDNHNNEHLLRFNDVYYLPGSANLLSEVKLTSAKWEIHKTDEGSTYYPPGNLHKPLYSFLRRGLHVMQFRPLPDSRAPQVNFAKVSPTDATAIWHNKMGHINAKYLFQTVSKGAVTGVPISSLSPHYFCETCQIAKGVKLPYKISKHPRKLFPGELIHADLAGPLLRTKSGILYFLLMRDEGTNFRAVKSLKSKDNAKFALMDFINQINNIQHGRHFVRALRTDNGTEFCNETLRDFLYDKGIRHETSVPHSPQMNGRAERDIRTCKEGIRALLEQARALGSKIPASLWPEALETFVYVMNRTLNSINTEKTAYELFFKVKPDLSHLQVWGSKAFVTLSQRDTKGFTPPTKIMYFVGYDPEHHSIYKFYDPIKQVVIRERNVKFAADSNPRIQPFRAPQLDIEPSTDVQHSQSNDDNYLRFALDVNPDFDPHEPEFQRYARMIRMRDLFNALPGTPPPPPVTPPGYRYPPPSKPTSSERKYNTSSTPEDDSTPQTSFEYRSQSSPEHTSKPPSLDNTGHIPHTSSSKENVRQNLFPNLNPPADEPPDLPSPIIPDATLPNPWVSSPPLPERYCMPPLGFDRPLPPTPVYMPTPGVAQPHPPTMHSSSPKPGTSRLSPMHTIHIDGKPQCSFPQPPPGTSSTISWKSPKGTDLPFPSVTTKRSEPKATSSPHSPVIKPSVLPSSPFSPKLVSRLSLSPSPTKPSGLRKTLQSMINPKARNSNHSVASTSGYDFVSPSSSVSSAQEAGVSLNQESDNSTAQAAPFPPINESATPPTSPPGIQDVSPPTLQVTPEPTPEAPPTRDHNLRNRADIRPPERFSDDPRFYFVQYKKASKSARIHEPRNYKEAMNSKKAEKWKEALIEEMQSQQSMNSWTLVKRPTHKKVLTGRWVFKLKGEDKFKARFVARGYEQKEGIDYHETFAPVCRFETLRTLLAVATAKQYKLLQFDVSTAFLNGILEEEIYMEQPEGFNDDSGKVCKLYKSLY